MARDNNGSTPFEDVDAADDFVGPLSRISTRETALASIFNEVQLFSATGRLSVHSSNSSGSSRSCRPPCGLREEKAPQKNSGSDIAIDSMTRFPKDRPGSSDPSMRELSSGNGTATQTVDASDFEVDVDASMSAEVDFDVDLDFDIDLDGDSDGPTEFGVRELDRVRGPKQPSLNAEMEEIRFLIDHDLLDDARETFATLSTKYPSIQAS